MGFNSWNAEHCNIDERKLRQMADIFISLGLKDVNYTYINVDDCWQVQRQANGTITPDPVRFPDGIKAVTDYIHSKGLKFGICEERKRERERLNYVSSYTTTLSPQTRHNENLLVNDDLDPIYTNKLMLTRTVNGVWITLNLMVVLVMVMIHLTPRGLSFGRPLMIAIRKLDDKWV